MIGEDTTLGSEKLHTFLIMVLRNATIDSRWPLTNNPAAKYNDAARPGCNLNLPLWQLVRASIAAPTYFPPEVIHIDHDFIFVDGGITMDNNPAFLTFFDGDERAVPSALANGRGKNASCFSWQRRKH